MVQQHGTSRSEIPQLGFLSSGFLKPALSRSALVVDHQLVVFLQIALFHDVKLVLSQRVDPARGAVREHPMRA